MIGTVIKWQRLIENFTFIRPGQAGGMGQQRPLDGGHAVPPPPTPDPTLKNCMESEVRWD